MKKQIAISFALVILSTSAALAQAQQLKLDKASAAKIVQLLEESGHNYGKAGENVWTIRYKGNHLPEFGVIVIGHENMLILVGVVAEKKDFNATPEMMKKLLSLNDDFDRVKVGIDDDGDLFNRIDLSLRVVDTQEFKANLEQLSSTVDLTYAAIKPYLVTAKKPAK
ncbi:MAG: hypothetical protein AB7U82_13770 [Blastocatellales bacterium]